MPHYIGYAAYREHWLFKAVRRHAFARADGVCEECESAPATECHHGMYPAWGAFDSPSNLQTICHECHCKKHGKTK